MSDSLPLLQALVDYFKMFPGVGEKTARRLAFAVLSMEDAEVKGFAETLLQIKERIGFCNRCGNLAEGDLCPVCRDPSRDESLLCIVERPSDLYVLESSGGYRGGYHVLHGVLSPLDGIGPEDLNLESLERRLEEGRIREVIVATNPSVEGDTTALFVSKMCKKHGIRVTRPARGLPMGSSLEYIDRGTIAKAFEGREPI